FYVTKPDDQEKRLFFYRHDDWLKMNRSFIFKSLNERYELVDEDFVKDLTLGSSPIWAVPKKTGFRLLTNLSKAMKQVSFYFSKVDIKQCFDTINQQKLLELLEYIFKDVSSKYEQLELTNVLY
ncbi:hypothetical protein BC941DRAFT_344317, partial [Chlamydoabsidia padenii]